MAVDPENAMGDKPESMEISTTNVVVEGAVRERVSRKKKMLALKITAVLALVISAAVAIALPVMYAQIGQDMSDKANTDITIKVYLEGDDHISHCEGANCTVETVKRPASEQPAESDGTMDDLKALLGATGALSQFFDSIKSGSVETRLAKIEAQLKAAAEAAYTKEREQREKSDIDLNRNSSSGTAYVPLGTNFPEDADAESVKEPTATDPATGNARQLTMSSGPSASVKTTPEFQKVIDAAERGDRRALSLFNFGCSAKYTQACWWVPYLRCSWRGCRWHHYRACVNVPSGFKCEQRANINAHCEINKVVTKGRCSVTGGVGIKLHHHGTNVKTGFTLNFGRSSGAYLHVNARFDLILKITSYCGASFDYVQEVGPKMPLIYCAGVPCVFLEAGAGFTASLEAGLSGTLTHTMPGNFAYAMGGHPHFSWYSPTTRLSGSATVKASVAAYLYAKVYVPKVAEMAIRGGIRAIASASVTVENTGVRSTGSLRAEAFVSFAAGIKNNPFSINMHCAFKLGSSSDRAIFASFSNGQITIEKKWPISAWSLWGYKSNGWGR